MCKKSVEVGEFGGKKRAEAENRYLANLEVCVGEKQASVPNPAVGETCRHLALAPGAIKRAKKFKKKKKKTMLP